MSRKSRRNRHRSPQMGQELVKANGLPAGTVAVSATALVQALAGQVVAPSGVEPLPRDQSWATIPFGPGMPLVPRPINTPRSDTGRPEPRRSEYPVSANLPGVDLRLVPWKVLRDAADQVDLIRRCIEVRKAEVIGLGWDIVVSDEAVEKARRDDPTASDSDVAKSLRTDLSDEIDRLKSWWQTPDRGNGFAFDDWLMQVIEEHLVLDALAIYPRLTLGGDLFSFEVLDGSTIKPLLDERGNTPLPPNPAYQQVLLGFPRGEFVADAIPSGDGAFVIPDGYQADQLIYQRRVVRTWTPYGYSAVEQALGSADMWLKRQAWMRAEYTDGVMPSGWITSDGNYTPEQLRAYNAAMNDYLSGLTQERHRFQILPKGMTPVEGKDAAERYKPDYDEFLLKLVCSHFGVLPSRLGFTPKGGLGGKGHQEGEEDSEERLSTRPTTEWLASLFTRMSRQYLGMDEQLQFRFLGLDAEDEAAADEQEDKRFRSGRVTLNETRDRLGKPRYDFPEADMPMIVGQSGVVFLEGEKQKQDDNAGSTSALNVARAAAYGVAPAPTPPPGSQVPSGSSSPGPEAGPGSSGGSGDDKAPQKAAADTTKKADELAALRRFASKGSRMRGFQCAHLTKADVPDDLHAVVGAWAKADDASRDDDGPSARGHRQSVASLGRSGYQWADPEQG